MNESCVNSFCCFRHHSWRLGIDREGCLLVLLCLIHCGGSCGVDGYVRTDLQESSANLIGVTKVELLTVEGDYRAEARKQNRQICSYLSCLSKQENLKTHFAYRGRRSRGTAANGGYLPSFSDTRGSETSQEIPISGSLQRIPCSSAGS